MSCRQSQAKKGAWSQTKPGEAQSHSGGSSMWSSGLLLSLPSLVWVGKVSGCWDTGTHIVTAWGRNLPLRSKMKH